MTGIPGDRTVQARLHFLSFALLRFTEIVVFTN